VCAQSFFSRPLPLIVQATVLLPPVASHGVIPREGDVANAAVVAASHAVRQGVHGVSLPVAVTHKRGATLAHPASAGAVCA
jgi:hypothetical protein